MDADGALKEVVTTSSVSLFCSCVCRLLVAPRFQRHHLIGSISATVTPGDPPRDYPFRRRTTDVDLAQYGCVEQGYFLQGTANQYTTTAGCHWSGIRTANPCKTRLLVPLPSPARRSMERAFIRA